MKKLIQGLGSSKLMINTTSLFIIQIANYILPFILIPYLTRVLGVTTYGIVAFGLSMVQIACVITDYGFALSATYQIAKNREDNTYVNKTIGAVVVCKLLLLVLVCICMLFYIHFQSKYEDYSTFFYLLIIPILGQTFQPIWFFQGLERMMYITLYTVASRLLYLGLVILFVESPDDLSIIATSNGFSQIIAAILGIILIYKLGYKIIIPELSFIKDVFMNSTEFFWSRAAVASYTAGGAFFLGLYSNPTQVAFYSAAEQLYRGAKTLFDPINQALYPHMAKNKNFKLFFKIFKVVILVSALGGIGGIFLGKFVLSMLFGVEFVGAYTVLLVFLFTFFITTPSVLLGYPFLGALGKTKLANRSVIYAGLLQLVFLFFCKLMNFIDSIDIAISVLLVETMVLVIRIYWAKAEYKTALT